MTRMTQDFEEKRIQSLGMATPLALALGGGSLRGWSHIGILKVFEEFDIRPSIVTGTSMGAIIGAAWAGGLPADEIKKVVMDISPGTIARVAIDIKVGDAGILRGDNAIDFLRPHIPQDFNDMKIRFGCVASNLVDGERVLFTQGDVLLAIRASFSLPVLFSPLAHDGGLLADGGMVEPVPVFAAFDMGARHVVAVSLNKVFGGDALADVAESAEDGSKKHTSGGQVARSSVNVMGVALARIACEHANLIISPDTRGIGSWDFDKAEEIIAAGEAAARENLPNLLLYSQLPTEEIIAKGYEKELLASLSNTNNLPKPQRGELFARA